MIDMLLEANINDVEVIKPNISGDFVPSLAPDVLLLVKGRLIWRKIFQMNLSMALQKKPDLFSFVPSSPIHIEINDKATELFQHVLQHLQESLVITFSGTYQTLPSQQGATQPDKLSRF